jgi:hypothetical protein
MFVFWDVEHNITKKIISNQGTHMFCCNDMSSFVLQRHNALRDEVIHPDGDDDADDSKRKPPVVEGREEEGHKKQKLPN